MNNILRCSRCGAVIYAWEETYRWHDGSWVCCECFDVLVSELERYEAAELMGCEVTMAENI